MGIYVSGLCIDDEKTKSVRRRNSANRESSIPIITERRGVFMILIVVHAPIQSNAWKN